MRLWSLHPKHLDGKGLVALWREALLAQAVLRGAAKGYAQHPQLQRFRERPVPAAFIAEYLRAVLAESVRRGYRFDAAKIPPEGTREVIELPAGQLRFEWRHLLRKLRKRAPKWAAAQMTIAAPLPHPLFRVTAGGVADWERPRPPHSAAGKPRTPNEPRSSAPLKPAQGSALPRSQRASALPRSAISSTDSYQ